MELDFFGPRALVANLSPGDLFLFPEPGVTYLAMKISINLGTPAVLIFDYKTQSGAITPNVVSVGAAPKEVIQIKDAYIQPSLEVSDIIPGHANGGNESTALYADGSTAYIISYMKDNGTVTIDLKTGVDTGKSIGHLLHTKKWRIVKNAQDGSASTIRSFP